MTDKVQKIRAFLVGIADADGVSTILAKAIEKKILPYIDSLQKEPVSEDLEKEIDKFFKDWGTDEINGGQYGINLDVRELKDIARHFVQWQKEQDQSTIELAEDHAMLAGMEKMKEEMMAKAVDGGCFSYKNGFVHISCDVDERITNIKFGDKVKLIIIKED